ncbi:MAG: hypothetical protein JSS81_02175 [Acidobacteria bacterium]|nr:hypothetical protein [Acidobacteriota bacterium]
MNNQICTFCGTQITGDQNGSMIFCTNCGSSLVNPAYQQTAVLPPPPPVFPVPKPKKGLSGGEKFWIGALIAVPIVLILGTVGVIILFGVMVSRNLPPPDKRYQPPTNQPKNAVLTFGSTGLGDGQFRNPASLAVGRDGSIYVGDGTLRIQKFDADGKFVKLWNVTESSVKTSRDYTNKVTGLAVDRSNTVYAAIDRKELLRYDGNTGKFLGKVLLEGEKWMNQKQEARILDMFMNNDDKLYVFATSFPRGEYVMTVAAGGDGQILFKDPIKNQDKTIAVPIGGGILVGVTGDIYLMASVPGNDSGKIYRFKSDGTYVDRFTWDGAPNLPWFSNNLTAIDSKGRIVAFAKGKRQLAVIDAEGVTQRTIPVDDDYPGERIVLDASDNVYVLTREKVEKYSSSGD